MSLESIDKLGEMTAEIQNPYAQEKFLLMSWTAAAGLLEHGERGNETFEFTKPEEVWKIVDRYLSTMAAEDRLGTFETGVALTALAKPDKPVTKMEKQIYSRSELIRTWLRTTGLSILGLEEYSATLSRYLRQTKAGKLVDVLAANMQLDVSNFHTEDSFRNPNGFTALQSIFIGLNLQPASAGPKVAALHNMALERLNDPQVLEVAKFYGELFPEYNYIHERFLKVTAGDQPEG